MPKTVRVLSNVSMDAVPFDALFAGNEPVILKGLASQWPMVLAGQKSAQTLIDMLIKNYDGKPVLVYEGKPEMRGRYTYNETVSGFNFNAVRRDLSEVLHEINALPEKDHPFYYYMNSITFDQTFAGLDKANTLNFNHEALQEAVIADLEPGDVLYYPSMWWHEVEAFDHFNVMVNYWWTPAPSYMGNPMDVLMHAMLNIRDRSEADKRAWRELFDYYIFGDVDIPRRHLPEKVQGALAEMDLANARRIRAAVHQSLKR